MERIAEWRRTGSYANLNYLGKQATTPDIVLYAPRPALMAARLQEGALKWRPLNQQMLPRPGGRHILHFD